MGKYEVSAMVPSATVTEHHRPVGASGLIEDETYL
jgi:hypothetical protein